MGKKTKTIAHYGISFGTAWLVLLGIFLILGDIFDWNFVLKSTHFGLGISIIIATLFATGFWSLRLWGKN